jgi:hypothetical protein
MVRLSARRKVWSQQQLLELFAHDLLELGRRRADEMGTHGAGESKQMASRRYVFGVQLNQGIKLTTDQIASDGWSCVAFGNQHAGPESWLIGLAQAVHHKMSRARHDFRLEQALVILAGLESPHSSPQRIVCLDRQALAAFGATGIEHRATATGLHANQKTMRAGTAGL